MSKQQAADPLTKISFNSDGLVPAIVQDATNGQVLMLAWMNRETLAETLTTGRAVYWSRSRQQKWRKGDTSGHRQFVQQVNYDCDADTILLQVTQEGAACHNGTRSCFAAGVLKVHKTSAVQP